MPRFANLKGSMNPFDNNKPVLSSSERLKNRRDKTIYQAQKQHFRSNRKCGNKNVKYYDNGTIRSTNSYKMNMKLSRGAVLCQDCKGNGTLCENIFDKNDLTKITMGNSMISTLNLGTGLNAGGCQINTTNIIIADINGVWGEKKNHYPLPWTPYGYATNLITVPRNLDGSGIIIDPSNILFPMDDNCNSLTIPKPNYLNYASIKTFIIYEGPMHASSLGADAAISNPGDTINTIQGVPNYFGNLINLYCVFAFGEFQGGVSALQNTGQVLKICPIGKRLMNDTDSGPPPGGSIFEVDIFRVYIEITNVLKGYLWQGSMSSSADKTNFSTQFKPNTISKFVVQGMKKSTDPLPFWIDSIWAANWNPGAISPVNGGAIEMSVTIDQNNVNTCNISQIRGNDTKQNYMSCLEDKTRKINFTDNTKEKFLIM